MQAPAGNHPEVCRQVPCEISPKDKNPLSFKSSRYNGKKSKGNCELCGSKGIDIHHMFPQELSNEQGFIKTFHKNHKANLMNICKECHENVTREKTIHKKIPHIKNEGQITSGKKEKRKADN